MQAPVALLERMLVRARGLFAARAYVHKYEAQGLGVGDFKEALEGAEALLDAYRAL